MTGQLYSRFSPCVCNMYKNLVLSHAQIKKVLSEGGPTQLFLREGLTQLYQRLVFILMRGGVERFQVPLKAGHHRPASETPFRRGSTGGDNGPIINDGMVALCPDQY